MPASEPVINHSSTSYQSASGLTSPPQASHDPSPQHSSNASPATRAPPASEAPTKPSMPSKSPFDFVSPFDAFDKPSPKPATPVGSASTKTQAPSKSTPEQKQSQDKHFAVPPAQINGTVIHPGDAAASTKPANSPSTAKPAQVAHTDSRKASPVNGGQTYSSTTQTGRGKGCVTTLVESRSTTDEGSPKVLQSTTMLNFSNLGDEAQTDSTDLVNTSPMTIMKTENIGFSNGRSVAMTANWFAYALSKGMSFLI